MTLRRTNGVKLLHYQLQHMESSVVPFSYLINLPSEEHSPRVDCIVLWINHYPDKNSVDFESAYVLVCIVVYLVDNSIVLLNNPMSM